MGFRLPEPVVSKSTGAFWYVGYNARAKAGYVVWDENWSPSTRVYTSLSMIMVVSIDFIDSACLILNFKNLRRKHIASYSNSPL